MAPKAQHIYLIQKTIAARDIHDALKREKSARIVEVSLTNAETKKLESAVGFIYNGPLTEDDAQ